ncbi:Crp/Fnr family transcriptional regulator [Pseudolysobacter antarcticus]|uniref:Crp/Fnr family transcriptional regulator n=1 Tax=Pseudolysobacter antarcticus TaxID=2511995 RepID=A0A411HLB6_9GAMM|nr:Crp/Fnr family transcriptional regulator [Pseudolysobacter antarcticus]QBB71167.1 Crp/Fnr family transcriptional regulator [Pseudolysobacter antarcticus]
MAQELILAASGNRGMCVTVHIPTSFQFSIHGATDGFLRSLVCDTYLTLQSALRRIAAKSISCEATCCTSKNIDYSTYYFPTNSFISMLVNVDEHSVLEVGMIGSEGMCGHEAIWGSAQAPLRALVQGAGHAWRMEFAAFQRHLENSAAVRQTMNRYVGILFRQLAQTAACTRFHTVEQRLARWLLMTGDRAHTDSFVVTQEFLSFMLGVQRAGVTRAAGALQARDLIQYTRGQMDILDRDALTSVACVCYQADLSSYQRGLARETYMA